MLEDPLRATGEFSDGYDERHPPLAPELLGAFRTPRLRCVASRPSFMHTGQLTSLENVVAFFSRGGDAMGYPGKNELTELDLTTRERADLVAFLTALEGPGPDARLMKSP
jgi:cytochrome c peroxidase